MATRFYLPSTGAAPVSVTKSSYWDGIENSAQADNYASCKAVITTISSAMTSRSLDGNTDGGDTNYAYGQWISDPIAAQTLSAQNLISSSIVLVCSKPKDFSVSVIGL